MRSVGESGVGGQRTTKAAQSDCLSDKKMSCVRELRGVNEKLLACVRYVPRGKMEVIKMSVSVHFRW